ncbi:hypothetical protein [Legionella spiritensis]|uniref:Uncharacterized protein n=1 Tax=Legionella spiritensis TaxID=452 RepID=A0A0W0YYW1_LEGSP|nr:hypothetical protein [Legionella spiritensis]KTD62085.1 hypothetical protein Lspi_1935 [Legionella spiritensis]SNV39569.1 Uncharacterised protein [Legionella spiritensis]
MTTNEEFGNTVDQLISLEARVPVLAQNVLKPLMDAARNLVGKRSVTMAAADGLVNRLKKGDVLFIITGAGTKETLDLFGNYHP